MNSYDLPTVTGRRLDMSNADFERRCLILLKEEQEKLNPDNVLVAILCDAVRLCREYSDTMNEEVNEEVKEGLQDESKLASEYEDPIEALDKISDKECTCTEEQKTGEDYTLCDSCNASKGLNCAYDEARGWLNDIREGNL